MAGQTIFIALIVFFSRIPFIQENHGLDGDAWRVFRAARRIATTGDYGVSRFPGNPVKSTSVLYFGSIVVLC